MNGNVWIRRVHRWTSIGFMAVVVGIFAALGLGREPAQWVYLSPLAPLAVMAITGLYMLVLPWIPRRGGPVGAP